MATPTIRQVVSAAASGGTATAAIGSGTAVNDLLLTFHSNDYYTAADLVAPSAPSGSWTLEATADAGTNGAHMKLWSRAVTTPGAQNVTVAPKTDEEVINQTYVIDGATINLADFEDGAATTNATATATTTPVAPAVSPSATSDALMISAVQVDGLQGNCTFTPPGDMTEQTDLNAAAFTSGTSAIKTLAATGSTGTKTFTATGNAKGYAAVSIAVKGGAGGGILPTVTWAGGTGINATTAARGTTSTTVAYTSVAKDRMAIISAVARPSSSTINTPAGWLPLTAQAGGTGAEAADTGTSKLSHFYKILDGTESGSVTVTASGSGALHGVMDVYSSSLAHWGTPVFVSGTDTTFAVGSSAVSGAWQSNTAVGDLFHVGVGIGTDNGANITVPTITATSNTFDTVTARSRLGNSDGNDSTVYTCSASVTAGAVTSAPTTGFTYAVSNSGAHGVVRLRAVPGEKIPPTLVSYTETTWNSAATTKSTASVAWQAGDYILVTGLSSDASEPISAVAATGLTLTNPGSAAGTAGTTCWGNHWHARPSADGSAVFTTTAGATKLHGIGVWVFRNSGGASARTFSSTTAKVLGIQRNQDESAMVLGMADFSGAVTTSYVWAPTLASASGTEREAADEGVYTVYMAEWLDNGAAANTTFGITGTASTGTHLRVLIEVQGGVRPPAEATTAAAAAYDATVVTVSGTSAPAEATTAAAAAANALASVGPNAEAATAVASALAPTTAITFTAESTTTVAAAFDATVLSAASPAAGTTAAAAAAFDATVTVAVAPTAQDASAAASAFDATVSTATATSAPAETTAAAAAALDASTMVGVNAESATVAATGLDASTAVGVQPQSTSAAAAALDAQVLASANAEAGTAAAAALDATVATAVSAAAEPTTVGAAAFDATVSTLTATSANAENASAAAVALDASVLSVAAPTGEPTTTAAAGYDASTVVAPNAGTSAAAAAAFDASVVCASGAEPATVSAAAFDATVTVITAGGAAAQDAQVSAAGFDATATVSPNADTTTAASTAFNASTVVAPNADGATVSASAFDAAPTVAANAEAGSVAAAAFDATITTTAVTSANAEADTATATAYDARGAVAPNAETDTVDAPAYDATVIIGVPAGAAAAGAAAFDATIALGRLADAGAASATAVALAATVSIFPLPGPVSVAASAFDATVLTVSEIVPFGLIEGGAATASGGPDGVLLASSGEGAGSVLVTAGAEQGSGARASGVE